MAPRTSCKQFRAAKTTSTLPSRHACTRQRNHLHPRKRPAHPPVFFCLDNSVLRRLLNRPKDHRAGSGTAGGDSGRGSLRRGGLMSQERR